MSAPLAPGATIGILGGGQLGRMLALAAARLGLDVHIFDADPAAPATRVAAASTCAAWDDDAALRRFAAAVDVVTYEWENVPLAAIDAVAALAPVRPGRQALEATQDRADEKRFLAACGLATAPWWEVSDADSLRAALAACPGGGILKTRRLGYDGRGQQRLRGDEDPAAVWAGFGAPAILEGLVPFRREVSVIAARGADGATAFYDVGENRHEAGILRETRVPAALAPERAEAAREAARAVLERLDYVGVLGLELFETEAGLVANEFAPRVHNTGHWTEAACLVSQFEQHVRAVALWPLGDPARHADCAMTNLLGDEAAAPAAQAIAAEPGAMLHLYGKAEARPGRKMGHVTRLARPG